jgi:hypothetical protein
MACGAHFLLVESVVNHLLPESFRLFDAVVLAYPRQEFQEDVAR